MLFLLLEDAVQLGLISGLFGRFVVQVPHDFLSYKGDYNGSFELPNLNKGP